MVCRGWRIVRRVGRVFRPAACLLTGALLALTPQPEWRRATPDFELSFPRDHGPHDGFKTEWWYFTGLLRTEDAGVPEAGPDLGYQFTIFKVGVLPEAPASTSPWSTGDLLMGHMAATDLGDGTHVFEEILYRAAPPFAGFGGADAGDTIAWSLPPAGTEGRWSLTRTETGFSVTGAGVGLSLSLALDTASAMVLQGPGGFSRKSDEPGRASMYYSYTDLVTTGRIDWGSGERSVVGTSWMDHEFSSDPLETGQMGWDWFSLRLDDGREVMAFQLRDSTGAAGFRHLTVVDADGSVSYADDSEWSLSGSAPWTSPETGAPYPQNWSLQSPTYDLDLTIAAFHPAAENVSVRVPGLHYWEGPVTITGTSGGAGYLEMTGYGDGSRPAL